MRMRAAGVIVRFIPLLDVAFILLGMVIILMAQAQIRGAQAATKPSAAPSLAEQAGLEFIYLYAGTSGEELGRCYELGPRQELLREIRTQTPEDLQRLLALRGTRGTPLVLLLISDQGFDAVWSEHKLSEMRKTWGVELARIYPFHRQPNK